jgi:hypothetical protein
MSKPQWAGKRFLDAALAALFAPGTVRVEPEPGKEGE